MRLKPVFLIFSVAVALFAGTAAADEHEHEHRESREHSIAKFYGVVNALPQNGITGTWLVNGREVIVQPSTKIKEQHGRLAVGVYVKVEGYPDDVSFSAQKIEVKGKRY